MKSCSNTDCSTTYNILYTKDINKKRKVYQDGTLKVSVSNNLQNLVLFDGDGKELKKASEKSHKSLSSGNEIALGIYSVQIDSMIGTLPPELKRVKQIVDVATEARKFTLPRSNFGLSNNSSVKKEMDVTLDPSIVRLLKPHQIDAANFILGRLKSPSGECSSERSAAILADEMGLGKTLTSICVIWSFIRAGACKAIVVCPSSLVANWEKEFKRWLGHRLKPICVKPGSNVEASINSFAISHINVAPLLLISYEMFRKYAGLINTVPKLELMVCDEGHRLKNADGTKTVSALRFSDHAVVIISDYYQQLPRISETAAVRHADPERPHGAVLPRDLRGSWIPRYPYMVMALSPTAGSLSEYQSTIATPITRGRSTEASDWVKEEGQAAEERLKGVLSKILLRRTQAEVLRHSLPPRSDYAIYHRLTSAQQAAYQEVVATMQRSIGMEITSAIEEEEEADEASDSLVKTSLVLPCLQQLRKICIGDDLRAKSGSDLTKVPSAAGGSTNFLKESAKAQIVVNLLLLLRQHHPEEKCVVVSNFTSTLDMVEFLARTRGWGDYVLRVDGKVPTEKRQPLIDRFNRPSDDCFLFLLSSKAGGVGINLIGGSRLVMMDPDWNPATDQQAMSRIWREGQAKPVFVYRLIAAGCIEHAILNRQESKLDLMSAIDGSSLGDELGSNENELPKAGLTKKDLQQLVFPAVELSAEDGGELNDALLEKLQSSMQDTELIAACVLATSD